MARRFDEIEAQLANPTGTFDQSRYTALVKERAQLEAPRTNLSPARGNARRDLG